MARWSPDPRADVNPNERIGRRLFDEPALRGVGGQPNFSGIPVTNFRQSDGDYSLDRLGASGLDKKVVRYLLPKARAAGSTRESAVRFDGWLYLPAKSLSSPTAGPKLTVVPSPVTGDEPGCNPYHAHVDRPDGEDEWFFALHLRELFTRKGEAYVDEDPPPPSTTLISQVLSWVKGMFRRE